MEERIQFVAVFGALLLLVVVVEFVRRRKLLERYALLWIFSAIILFFLAALRPALLGIAEAIGIYYPPSALFFVAFGFVLALLLHYSLVISRLSEQSMILAQRLSQLELKVEGDNGKRQDVELGLKQLALPGHSTETAGLSRQDAGTSVGGDVKPEGRFVRSDRAQASDQTDKTAADELDTSP